MSELAILGRKRTILIGISMLLVSIHTIYFFHAIRPDVDAKKLIQQIIRFLMTLGLLLVAYRGKKWATAVLLVLCSLAALGAMIGLVTLDSPSWMAKIPLLVMALVYSIAIYLFGFSKSYKAFMEHQRITGTERTLPHGPM